MRTIICTTIMLASLAITPVARASGGRELWQGQGVLFDRSNRPIRNYRLEVYRTEVSATKSLTEVKIFLPDGTVKNESCETTKTAGGWVSDCKLRKGSGACFGDGLCIDYSEDRSGHAFATTIVMDGQDAMRLLRTELVNGKAVRFFREKLGRTTRRADR
jgi:hypothetical protein